MRAVNLTWDLDRIDLTTLTPAREEHPLTRLSRVVPDLIREDTGLEGYAITQARVAELLTVLSPHAEYVQHPGDDLDVLIPVALIRAYSLLTTSLGSGMFVLGREHSDALHAEAAQYQALDAGRFRGGGQVGGGGTVRTPEGFFDAHAPGEGGVKLREVYAEGLAAIGAIAHPVLRGATYASWAAYHQFYHDGNKRTGRLMMNGVLIAGGYHPIVVRAEDAEAYHGSLTEMYATGDATPAIAYLAERYVPG